MRVVILHRIWQVGDFEGNAMSHFPIRFAARISVGKAAKLLGVHRNTLVRSWFKEKGLIRLKMSPTGRWFVETRELERILNERTLAGALGSSLKPSMAIFDNASKMPAMH